MKEIWNYRRNEILKGELKLIISLTTALDQID